MKVHSSLAAFWDHYSMRFGISLGWDFEQPYKEFVEQHEKEFAEANAMTITHEEYGCEVSELDIAKLGFGEVTPNALNILKMYKRHADGTCSCGHGELADDAVVLQSMHSGSSDMLFIKDIRQFFEMNPEA